ncbi:hypothetical protein HQ590_10800, partial [bacterium]|nr:hypothetical protein [bacterium]
WGVGVGGWAEYGTHDEAWQSGLAPGQDRGLQSRVLVLNQAFVDVYGDAFDLTVGKQFLRQGVGRIYSPLDRYSPWDYREPVEREALGIWQVRTDYYPTDSLTLSLVILPVYQPPKLPDPQSPWILDTSSFPAASLPGDLNPQLADSSPRVGLENTSLLLQQRTTGAGWDWVSSVYYGLRPVLTGRFVPPATIRVDRDATRVLEVGNGLSAVTGLFEWHAEALYSRPEDRGPDEYLSFLVGITRNLEELTNALRLQRATVTIEYAGEWLIDEGRSVGGVDITEALRFGQETLLAQLTVAPDDNWSLRLTGVHETDGDGSLVRFTVERRITDGLTVGGALDLLIDTRDGPYANWDDNDRVTLVARYSF